MFSLGLKPGSNAQVIVFFRDFRSPLEAFDYLREQGENPENYELREWCDEHRLGTCSECELYPQS